MKKASKKEQTNTFKDILRKGGNKITPARLAVIKVLESTKVPLSITQIIKKIGLALDEVTIYRTVELFQDLKIVRQVNFRHQHSHYELVHDKDHHHHLICNDCGKVEDIKDFEPANFEKSVLSQSVNFKIIESHALEFFGYCNNCVKL